MSVINLDIEEKNWISLKSFDEWCCLFEKLFNSTTTITTICSDRLYSINVLLSNNECIQKINKQFRNINSPTNVLSFPQYSKKDLKTLKNALLGDIVLSYNSIDSEALAFQKDFCDRISHLFVHGVLHTLGFTHDTKYQRSKMERLEAKILKEFNIKDLYLYS
ncbi:MAG: rRNA maturation RNase YbeY [Holosporales bacterium]|jgi:probable rRNA maturation factor|nr:rRNA maturation RNase YbeY [Holosporales bacterium]